MKTILVLTAVVAIGLMSVSFAEASSVSRKLGITETKTDRIMPQPRRSTRR